MHGNEKPISIISTTIIINYHRQQIGCFIIMDSKFALYQNVLACSEPDSEKTVTQIQQI